MKISIITATLDCVARIGDCLDSVAGQSHTEREHIIIDGASTDGTLAVLEGRRDRLAVLVSEPDGGIYEALNKGLARATGEVVGFLHADDVYGDAEVLASIAAAFRDPKVMAVYGDLDYLRRLNPERVVRHWRAGEFDPAALRWGWMPPHPTLYLRRSVFQRLGEVASLGTNVGALGGRGENAGLGAFDTRYRIAADYDLILRVLGRMEGRVVYLPRVLVRMRTGGASNRTLNKIMRKSWEDYLVLSRNGFGGPVGLGALGAVAWKNVSKLPQFFQRG